MSSPKFKIGDRVVFTNLAVSKNWHKYNIEWGNKEVKIGTIINSIPFDGYAILFEDFYGYRDNVDGSWHTFAEDQLELEEIWDSPLYQALRED